MTKKDLAKKLRAAAELEHQFTCMYLYAAFSLKKNADERCNSAQVEITRRWASTVYMVARQEMEHLAIVNQLLAAIGEPPHFDRPNIPVHSKFFQGKYLFEQLDLKLRTTKRTIAEEKIEEALAHLHEFLPEKSKAQIKADVGVELSKYVEGDMDVADKIEAYLLEESGDKACDMPFLFTPFNLKAARRFTCMESPYVVHLILSGQEDIARDILKWGFKEGKLGSKDCACILPPEWQGGSGNPDADVQVGDIEMYYEEIKKGFKILNKTGDLFVPTYQERQVNILSEYNIYIFPITDLASANNGIELIVKQGEAIGSSPGFDSHFRNFYDIAKAYETELDQMDCGSISYENFQPFLDILTNPKRTDIQYDYTLKVFDLFNYSYKTMCYCLNGLYGWYTERKEYPFLAQALRDLIFAPTMTMLIRSLGEVLNLLPARSGTPTVFAAPNFDMYDKKNYLEMQEKYQKFQYSLTINPDVNGGDWQHSKAYQFYQDLSFYTHRFEVIIRELKLLAEGTDSLETLQLTDGHKQELQKRLTFIYENTFRMTANLRRNYEDNVYDKLDPF